MTFISQVRVTRTCKPVAWGGFGGSWVSCTIPCGAKHRKSWELFFCSKNKNSMIFPLAIGCHITVMLDYGSAWSKTTQLWASKTEISCVLRAFSFRLLLELCCWLKSFLSLYWNYISSMTWGRASRILSEEFLFLAPPDFEQYIQP